MIVVKRYSPFTHVAFKVSESLVAGVRAFVNLVAYGESMLERGLRPENLTLSAHRFDLERYEIAYLPPIGLDPLADADSIRPCLGMTALSLSDERIDALVRSLRKYEMPPRDGDSDGR